MSQLHGTVTGMKPKPFYRWTYADPECGVIRYTTTYRMDPEEAQRRFPGAEPIEGTLEMRNLPNTRRSDKAAAT